MPAKQKKSTASEETEEVDHEVEETEPELKEKSNGVTNRDRAKGDKSRKKDKRVESPNNQEATEKEKKKESEKPKEKKRKKNPDYTHEVDAVIENDAEEGEQNNNDPRAKSKKEKLKEEVTEGAKEEKKKKKKKSSVEDLEEEMGSKDKKSKDGKKKKKSHNDDEEEPVLDEQEEEEDSKKKKKKKGKKGSADSDDDKKKKGKKSKNKQVDYAAIYQNELLNYHTDSSDGYEDEYYKKKGKDSTLLKLPILLFSSCGTFWSILIFPPVVIGIEQGLYGESLCDCSWVKAQLCSTWTDPNRGLGADRCWVPSQSHQRGPAARQAFLEQIRGFQTWSEEPKAAGCQNTAPILNGSNKGEGTCQNP